MATILVVEDDFFIRQNAELTLADLGHLPLVACDLAGALEHLHAPAWIDVLFVDIRLDALPLGGYDVANQAIIIRPELRVLYTSGSRIDGEMVKNFTDSAQFIQKPYSPEQFMKSIDDILSARDG